MPIENVMTTPSPKDRDAPDRRGMSTNDVSLSVGLDRFDANWLDGCARVEPNAIAAGMAIFEAADGGVMPALAGGTQREHRQIERRDVERFALLLV